MIICQTTKINHSKKSLPTLLQSERLDLSSKNISNTEYIGLFSHLSSLEELKFDNNKMTRIYKNTFSDLQQLQKISISWNKELSTIDPEAFQQNQNLSNIKISNNTKLYHLYYDVFKKLTNLSEVDLSQNILNTIPPKIFKARDGDKISFID